MRLYQGKVYMYVSNKENHKLKEAIFNLWLKQRANKFFRDSIEKIYEKLEKYSIPKPSMKIRLMKSRWGSCIVNSNKIILNPQLIKAPKSCIDYVVLHELSHFKHHNHDRSFYDFLSAIMPDWRERKND